MKPSKEAILEVYADADFDVNWNKATAKDDGSTAKSRTGIVITFAKCPILWTSKLQTEIALNTIEAEYMALSSSLRREALLLLELIEAMRHEKYIDIPKEAKVYCKCFKNNFWTSKFATIPKMRPRIKDIVYRHFREGVKKKIFKIYAIDTEDQVADISQSKSIHKTSKEKTIMVIVEINVNEGV